MKFSNYLIYTEDNCFKRGTFEVRDGKFCDLTFSGENVPQPHFKENPSANVSKPHFEMISQRGDSYSSDHAYPLYIIPGLIDIHTHGNSGYDFSTCSDEGLEKMATYLASNGITSFTPASLTLPYETLSKAYENAAMFAKRQFDATNTGNCPLQKPTHKISTANVQSDVQKMSHLIGIYMEGPFFSYGKRGAQNPAHLRLPDTDAFEQLQEAANGLIKTVCVAPELDGACSFIEHISKSCTVSVAHTEADYDTASAAFQAGATGLTHTFNAMNPFDKRSPGPVGAAFDNKNVYAELICDGIHIHPSVLRAMFELFKNRVVMISDALSCCGMPDGQYNLGGLNLTLNGKKSTLDDGTIAGSANNLFDCLRNVIHFGIPVSEAIAACTINPARHIGIDKETGSIAQDKRADFLIVDEYMGLIEVYIDGKPIIH